MARRVGIGLEVGKTFHRRVVIEVEEGREGISLFATAVDDTVKVRDEMIVAPDLHHVAKIYDQRILDIGSRYPLAVPPLKLQPADRVLRKDSDHAEVGVRRNAEREFGIQVLRRIVEKSGLNHRLARPDKKEILLLAKRQREQTQEIPRDTSGGRQVSIGGSLQPRRAGRPTVRPVQRPPLYHVGIVFGQ